MSTDPFEGGVVCSCGFACANATVAEASKSAAVPIISLLRIAIILLTYRSKALPDGAFEP